MAERAPGFDGEYWAEQITSARKLMGLSGCSMGEALLCLQLDTLASHVQDVEFAVLASRDDGRDDEPWKNYDEDDGR